MKKTKVSMDIDKIFDKLLDALISDKDQLLKEIEYAKKRFSRKYAITHQ